MHLGKDANDHVTKTYKDGLGRVIRTQYNDGTSSQTLYGVSNQPVTGHNPNPPDPLVAMQGQTIDGYQVTRWTNWARPRITSTTGSGG